MKLKTALLTGASSGIGASVARELARRGYALALVARRADRLAEVAEEARSLGAPEAVILPADLADPATLAPTVEAAVDRLGGLDVLLNNAGIGLPMLFAQADPELIRRQIAVNFTAPLLLTRHALPHLAGRRGTVINIGSAITVLPNPVLGAYGPTKAGLAWWSEALRHELRKHGVKVCLVEPGPVSTEFFRAVESLAPEDQARPQTPPIADAITGNPDDLARRIAGLLDRPRARLSYRRSFVLPWRALGGLLRAVPFLGDAAMDHVLARIERESAAEPPAVGVGAEVRSRGSVGVRTSARAGRGGREGS